MMGELFMEYSYSDFSNNEMDLKLIELVLEGNGYALEELIKKISELYL